jgi:hypothetical protein
MRALLRESKLRLYKMVRVSDKALQAAGLTRNAVRLQLQSDYNLNDIVGVSS